MYRHTYWPIFDLYPFLDIPALMFGVTAPKHLLRQLFWMHVLITVRLAVMVRISRVVRVSYWSESHIGPSLILVRVSYWSDSHICNEIFPHHPCLNKIKLSAPISLLTPPPQLKLQFVLFLAKYSQSHSFGATNPTPIPLYTPPSGCYGKIFLVLWNALYSLRWDDCFWFSEFHFVWSSMVIWAECVCLCEKTFNGFAI